MLIKEMIRYFLVFLNFESILILRAILPNSEVKIDFRKKKIKKKM